MTDAIGPLADRLACGEDLLGWIVQHAPDGSLRAAWEACPRGPSLVHLCGLVGDLRVCVRAALECARVAAEANRGADSDVERMLDRIAAYLYGNEDPEVMRENVATDAQQLFLGDYSDEPNAFRNLRRAAAYTGYALWDAEAPRRRSAASCAHDAVFYAACALGGLPVDRQRILNAQRRLADTVRRIAPCPELSAVIAAARGELR